MGAQLVDSGLPKVNVLLSAYNGARYISEQLDSVLSQVGVQVSLYIRDDGSSDDTLQTLERYNAQYEKITVFSGANIGYVASFFKLMLEADRSADYFALCDQDDVWLPEKLATAVGCIKNKNNSVPLMYFSRTEYVDQQLSHLGFSADLDILRIGYRNALVQNVATGCTIVFNKKARDVVISKLPEYCLVHDWWIYLVVATMGEVVYDRRTFIKYRQHPGNAIGAAETFWGIYKRRLQRFFSRHTAGRVSLQLAEFNRLYADSLSNTQRENLQLLVDSRNSVSARLRLLFNNGYTRNNKFDSFLLKIMILIGRF
jgi:glycosyltransferase involved in cell wall biosynthesis